jgi:hypothetical protein
MICAYALSPSVAKAFGVNKILRLLRISRMFKLVKGIKVRRSRLEQGLMHMHT